MCHGQTNLKSQSGEMIFQKRTRGTLINLLVSVFNYRLDFVRDSITSDKLAARYDHAHRVTLRLSLIFNEQDC